MKYKKHAAVGFNPSFVLFFLVILFSYASPKTKHARLFSSPKYNFYEVDKNRFFRSRQLSPTCLKKFITQFGIKTIINLRGENKKASWWQKEKQIAQEHNVHFYSIPMSARRLPHKKDLITLLTLYQNAPRPILVHCRGGADRTGEATALWILDQQKKRKKDALKHLAMKYGHFSFKSPSKRFFVKLWQGRNWACHTYDPKNHPKYHRP